MWNLHWRNCDEDIQELNQTILDREQEIEKLQRNICNLELTVKEQETKLKSCTYKSDIIKALDDYVVNYPLKEDKLKKGLNNEQPKLCPNCIC